MVLGLLALAVIPGVVIALLIYRLDKLEREPKKELIKATFMGVFSVILTLLISYIFGVSKLNYTDYNIFQMFLFSFLAISLVEEFSKWISSCLFLRKNNNFNYLFDGVVYVTFVSLGFATVENILYTIQGGVFTGLLRAFTTVPAHAFFGMASGYYLSLAKSSKVKGDSKKSKQFLFLSLFIPFLLHGFYDFCLLAGNIVLFLCFLVFVVLLYILSIRRTKKLLSRDESFIKNKVLFCSDCGTRVIGNFCANCGRSIEDNS